MPLRFALEPQNGSKLIRDGFNQPSVRRGYLSGLGVDFNTLQLATPHAIYDLRADEIASGEGLNSAHRAGFRYIVHAAVGPVAAAEVHTDSSGKATLLSNTNYGPFVKATPEAFADLEKLEQVGAGSYEARLLRFSAIPLMSIWLKSESGGADIIYPLSTVPGVVEAKTTYTADEFLKAILPMAKQRAESEGVPMVP
jgi:hypothetical protein